MKSVRIASAVKHIEEADHNIILFRIQEILAEHRSTLIMGVLNDLPSYLAFKLYKKVDKEQQAILKSKLLDLARSPINLDRYDMIVQEIRNNSTYRVPSQEFFKEIDALLDVELNPSQLSLMG